MKRKEVPTLVSPYEDYVLSLRRDPGMQDYVQKHYLDSDLSTAVQRYSESREFKELSGTLSSHMPPQGRLLDIGIGRGLTCLAFHRHGFSVTGLEYDGSSVSGIGALAKYLQANPAPINVLQGDGLSLPFGPETFDAVFCRSVLHHLPNLRRGLDEMFRVLKPNGMFLAWNEHISSVGSSKKQFLQSHPAVRYGVNENAYPIPLYWRALRSAGFRNIDFLGHFLDPDSFKAGLNPASLRGRLSVIPGVSRALYQIHKFRRSIIVDEAALPVVSITAQRPGNSWSAC